MSSDDAELEENEYPLAIKIFSVLRWAMVGCGVLTLIVGIYLLFKGYPWYFVIPGYLILNIFFRVMKTCFQNIVESLQSEQDEMGNQTF